MHTHLPSELPSSRGGRDWVHLLTKYRIPSARRGLYELAITLVPLVGLWVLSWQALSISIWLTLLIAVPAAGFLVRAFMIQHDCGHGAFFRRRATNDWVGRMLGVLTLTPYDVWRRSHAVHHATTGNLDQRGIGDICTLTVDEYHSQTWRGRLAYRLYRHPLVLFGLGPGYVFMLQNRLPLGVTRGELKYWFSAMATNLGIAVFIVGMMALVGVKPFLSVHVPIVLLAATIGVWLFYIQHQFENTHWEEQTEWDVHDAALHGSSHYDLPSVLRWFTANIGVHHVHHLCSRIPYYRLPDVLRDFPELAQVKRVTLLQSFRYTKLRLWDSRAKRLVSFREVKQSGRRSASKA